MDASQGCPLDVAETRAFCRPSLPEKRRRCHHRAGIWNDAPRKLKQDVEQKKQAAKIGGYIPRVDSAGKI